jgi:hypothetical protein
MSDSNKKLKCGLIMPISSIDGCTEAHWDEVRLVIKEALSDTAFSVEVVSDSNDSGIIQKRIVQNIYDNDMVVCDVSAKNPNVMFELGMRLAFDKPAIIIKDDKTNYSFDTSPIEHLTYPRDLHYHSIQVFKNKLKDKVTATYEASKKPEYTTFLKHFGQFVVAKIDEKRVGKDEFLLAAVSELRNEVGLLGRVIRGREANSGKLLQALHLTDLEPRGEHERDFLLKVLPKNLSPTMWQDLENPESELFQNLLQQYIQENVPPNIAIKERHVQLIGRKFLEEIQRLRNPLS